MELYYVAIDAYNPVHYWEGHQTMEKPAHQKKLTEICHYHSVSFYWMQEVLNPSSGLQYYAYHC